MVRLLGRKQYDQFIHGPLVDIDWHELLYMDGAMSRASQRVNSV